MLIPGIRQRLIAAGCMLALLRCAAPAFAQGTAGEDPAFFVSFQVPGYHDTYPLSINKFFSIAGYCSQATTSYHGFVRDAWGTTTLIDPPGSFYTIVRSINTAGAVVGYFEFSSVDPDFTRSFVRSRRGIYTTFDYLGNQILAFDINDAGAVTGFYIDGSGQQHGFLRSPRGEITSFDPPGSTTTLPTGINEEGIIVGSYTANGSQHGFVRDLQGDFTTFDAPGAQTAPSSIDAAGTIVGWYNDTNMVTHGFVRSRQGTVTTFDPPGSVQTAPQSVNRGKATGTYFSDLTGDHGFVLTRKETILVFDYLGGVNTNAWSINDFGAITGTYENSTGMTFGFIRVPERW